MKVVRMRLTGLVAFGVACMMMVQICDAQPQQGRGGQGRGGQQGRGGFGSFGGRGGGGVDRGTLLSAEQVQKDLKLTEGQKKQLTDMQTKRRESQRTIMAEFRDLSQEERTKRFEQLREEGREFEKKLVAVLSESQQQRLSEVYIQLRGVSALLDEKVGAELELSDEQKTKIRTALESGRGGAGGERPDFSKIREMSEEERREWFTKMQDDARKRREESETKALAVLDDIQRDLWDLLQGEKVEYTSRDIMASRFRGAQGGQGRGGFGGQGRGEQGGGRGRGGQGGGEGRGGRGGRGRPQADDDN